MESVVRFALGACLSLALSSLPVQAGEPRSDARSLSELFGSDLSSDALEVHRRTRNLPPAERYDVLLGRVMPVATDDIRIAIDFLPTNPSPPVLKQYGAGEFPLLAKLTERRVPSGGALVAPALELVDTARVLGRLGELREQVRQRAATPGERNKARQALLTLIAGAEGHAEPYGRRLNEFMTLVRESPVVDPQRAPEVVVAWQGASRPELQSEIREFVLMLHEQMKSDRYPHRERVKRHVFSLSHLLDERLVQSGRKNQHPVPRGLTEQWHPASRRTAWTQGNGFPNAAWTITPTRARHISCHGDDYLYFNVPLRGNYEIEGDLSTFGYREIHLTVGTIWAGPLYDHERITWGNFRSELPHQRLDPRFHKLGDQIRVRVAVRGGVRTTSVNGRKVFTHPQGPASDPWISAHGPWHTSGVMENIRISGTPEIPTEIDLLAGDDLPGWLPYFGESIGGPQKEWFLEQPQATGLLQRLFSSGDRSAHILRGRKKRLLSGSFHESLLRYHRPMLEDGAIEYDFFYQPGESCVFPALDRLAFLFDSERVGIHWVTDGKFDPSGADPANFTPVESGAPPSLVPGAWNRLRLSLTGDTVEIAVNGQRILTRELEPENLRTFGLFFYSDQTESRVRNLRWRGEWPKKLPPLERQELADLSLEEELERGPELSAVFEHDFSAGLPLEKIWVAGKDWQQHVRQGGHGLSMIRGGGDYEKISFAIPMSLQGDFDVTWEFEDFQSSVAEGGNGNLHALILFEDENSTECRVYRKQSRLDDGRLENLVQPAIFYNTPDGKTRYEYPVNVADESAAGKLRLVRRGTVMYFLFAEGESGSFQLAHRATVPDAPVKFAGIKGIIETHREGETRASWKRVTLKAESIPELLEAPSFTVAELDAQRSQLSNVFVSELTPRTETDRIAIHGDRAHITRMQDGWLIREPGADSWRATGISPQVELRGDFDVTLELEVLQLDSTKQGAEATVLLHAGFATARPLGIEIKYSRTASPQRDLEIQMNSSGRDRGMRYDELKHQQTDEVTQFRIARRGPIAYLIYRGKPDAEPQIYGRMNVGEAEIKHNSLRAIVHTGDKNRETIVKFKSLTIHAEDIR